MKKVHRNVKITAIAVLAGLLITACGEAPEPTVSDVTIDPAEATVMRSRSRYFVATVTGTNDPAQTVMWSIVESDVHTEN